VPGGQTSAWVRQRPPALRATAWILAVAGPALLTLAARSLSLHEEAVTGLLQGGCWFGSLVLVVALTVIGGIRPALTAMVLSVLTRIFFFAPPFTVVGVRPVSFACFVITGVGISVIISRLTRVATEQAALRRVATLAAHSVPEHELFAAATEEAGRLSGADYVRLGRYESGDLVGIAAWRRSAGGVPATGRWSRVQGFARSFTASGHRGRIAGLADAYSPLAEDAQAHGIQFAATVPIMASGRPWGVMLAGSIQKWAAQSCLERCVAGFADLLGAAISNAESREGITRLAEEQTALRRVATLVARGARPEAVFTAVTEETGQLLGVEITAMIRYESDGTTSIVASRGRGATASVPVGDRQPLGGKNLATIISETASPARLDHYGDASGAWVARLAELGFRFRSGVGAPIMVQGRLWGAVLAASVDEHPLSPDAEARIGSFTDLVATAVSNAEHLAELTASRARVVAASDQARRQIERDLHDGAQQRLVSLTLAVRAAQAAVPPMSGPLGGELARVADGLASVLDDLRELARGIHPTVLSQGGLGPALKTLAKRSIVPVELDLRAIERLPEPVEVAAYYVISEALTNAAKHSNASVVQVGAEVAGNALHLHVLDDGDGGADPALGSGLMGLKDRVEALGGTIAIRSPAGAGTSLDADVPLADQAISRVLA
jgi:signal transduction histidine kinase